MNVYINDIRLEKTRFKMVEAKKNEQNKFYRRIYISYLYDNLEWGPLRMNTDWTLYNIPTVDVDNWYKHMDRPATQEELAKVKRIKNYNKESEEIIQFESHIAETINKINKFIYDNIITPYYENYVKLNTNANDNNYNSKSNIRLEPYNHESKYTPKLKLKLKESTNSLNWPTSATLLGSKSNEYVNKDITTRDDYIDLQNKKGIMLAKALLTTSVVITYPNLYKHNGIWWTTNKINKLEFKYRSSHPKSLIDEPARKLRLVNMNIVKKIVV